MKKSFCIILLALICGVCPMLGQSSTEGRTFWVAVPIANAPGGKISGFEPFIAISAKKACRINISNPSTGWTAQVRNVQANSWTVVKDIPVEQWYDLDWKAANCGEKVDNKGILVEASEDVSVYAAMRMEYSYDASNILPITAIQSEYILQDYPPFNSEGDAHSTFVIVASENNTVVEITPSTPTIGGKPANTRFTVTLNKGQTYQVVSTDQQTFSGTRVKAKDGRKIAVFSGADFTQVPGGKSARDCLYEQAMPIDYWGNEFVVTRSVERDANRIRITAQEDGTQINMDGYYITTINSGETYEFEMSENLAPTIKEIQTKAGREIPDVFNGESHFIQTSCPVAVFCYDVSSEYRFKETTKIGDPSMVWMSPLQQRISKITFGACGTSGSTGHTNRHYVNVVCLTADIANVTLSSEQRANIPLTFTPVPGNSLYSYARTFLVDTDEDNPDKVYTLSSKSGVVAHVYGSGNNESYAYSVGSSAVKRGVMVEGETYIDGYTGQTTYCVNVPVDFDAQVGTDIIDKVDWDFGDGVSEKDGTPQISHLYDVPGWYDVTANIYAHKECPETQYPAEQVHFSFRVLRPDTIRQSIHECKPEDYVGPMIVSDTVYNECISVTINTIEYGKASSYSYDLVARDSCWLSDGQMHYTSGAYSWTLPNANSQGCDSTITCNLRIITCLEMDIPNNPEMQHICPGDPFDLPFIYYKGDIGETHFQCGTINQIVYPSTSSNLIALPTESLQPGTYQASITVQDTICQQTLQFPLNIQVYYPKDIFNYKFGNVLAVYTQNYNGGYQFVGYQWYKNGLPIEGAVESIYHTPEMFNVGDVYYVMLTRVDGLVLPSCSQTIEYIPQHSPEREENVAPKKVVNNQRFYIEVDGQLYNLCGLKVQ